MTIDLTEVKEEGFPLLVFCLGVYFITFVFRRLMELVLPRLVGSIVWKKALRATPALVGGIAAAIMHKYPYLSTLPSWGSRFVYGMVAGGLSGFFYTAVKAYVQAKWGVKVNESEPPLSEDDKPTDPIPRESTTDPAPSSEPKP